MPQRPRFGLILAAYGAASLLAGGSVAGGWVAGDAGPRAERVGSFALADGPSGFGGFSGLEFSDDGLSFTALSDSAALVTGTVRRDARGAITSVEISPPRPIVDAEGLPLVNPFDDAEGLAAAANGDLFVSYELEHRIVRYAADGRQAAEVAFPPDLVVFEKNSGLEALALAPDGALYALPEGDTAGARTAPVFRFHDGRWDRVFEIAEQDSWRPVGADFGPDGCLYLLERDFWGLLGFKSRLRRLCFDDADLTSDAVLFASRAGQMGNLEGVSIWQSPGGVLRATMISDNNFMPMLGTEFVDFVIHE